MKTRKAIYTATLILTSFIPMIVTAQQRAAKNQLTTEQEAATNAISLENYEAFKASVKPLIDEMGVKKIVGLGEGTHGTAEFYKVRYWITRILVEEKGFNHVAFENDVTETWALNRQLASTANLNALMQKYMMSIWQNEETKELLQWVKTYNTTHEQKVTIDGIDYPVQRPDVDMLKELLEKVQNTSFDPAIVTLASAAAIQDESWFGMNKKGYKADWKVLSATIKKGYITADSVEQQLKKIDIEPALKADLLLAVSNLKQGFEPFYRRVGEGKRDSIMAYNASQIVKKDNDKLVIWAHNAHLGKKGIYDNAVGGTGGYILKLFPNNYFALGTGTATGTFGGTTDARVVNTSLIAPYKLEKPIDGSWEAMLSSAKSDNYYFKPQVLNPNKEVKPLRFIGYGTSSGKTSYDDNNLVDMFDAFLFLKKTNAPTGLK